MKLIIPSLLFTAVLFSFNACSNDNDDIDSMNESQPSDINANFSSMTGTASLPTETKGTMDVTRSGFIEDNPNYEDGEQFYWVNGDSVRVLFFKDGDLNSTPAQVIYIAQVAEGEKPYKCEFTTDGELEDGNYTAYALYPANAWKIDQDLVSHKLTYKITMPDQLSLITENENSPSYGTSQNAGKATFLKAKVNTTAENGKIGHMDMHFKCLSSVVRFHLKESVEKAGNQPYVDYVQLKFNGNHSEAFPTEAILEGGIDGDKVNYTTRTGQLTLTIHQPFNPDKEQESCLIKDVFIPIIPTGPFKDDDYLTIIIGTGQTKDILNAWDSIFPKKDLNGELTFGKDIPFLKNGFEAGKSYAFNLTL